jgi:hypothetical protein
MMAALLFFPSSRILWICVLVRAVKAVSDPEKNEENIKRSHKPAR